MPFYFYLLGITASSQEVAIFVTLLLFGAGHLFLVSKWAGSMQETMKGLKEGFEALKKELNEIRQDLRLVTKLESHYNTMDFRINNQEERIAWLEEHCKLISRLDPKERD